MAAATIRPEMNAMTGMASQQSDLGADGLVVLLALGAAAQLIAAADAFLHAAKAAGRNRTATTLADSPAMPLQYS
jgi:PleD family two-component response regulator